MLTKKFIARFVEEFGACLADEKWLPVLSPPYEVVVPDPKKIDPIFPRCEFGIKADGMLFGALMVKPLCQVEGTICLSRVDTKLAPDFSGKGYGREFVRRTVYYAWLNEACWGVTTTPFEYGAATFTLGFGFKPVPEDLGGIQNFNISPNWALAGTISQQEIGCWKKRLSKEGCRALWDLSQTEVGKRVLVDVMAQGVLDFRNDEQRSYAFQRLKLNDRDVRPG